LVRVGTPEFDRTRKESLKLYQKYQCSIHEDTLAECEEKQVHSLIDLCDV